MWSLIRDETAEECAKDSFENAHVDLVCVMYDGGRKRGGMGLFIENGKRETKLELSDPKEE